MSVELHSKAATVALTLPIFIALHKGYYQTDAMS